MNDNNKKIIKTSVLAISVFAIILSVTYAFINVTLQGEKKQVITTGNLDLVLDEDENNLTITDALPMYDEVGMMQDAFTFRIINNTTTDTNYILKLTDITTGDALDKTIVKYGLTKNGVGEPALLSTLPDDGTVDSGTIGNKEIIEYSLRLWIDASVTDNSVISGKSLSYRVDLEVNQIVEEIQGELVAEKLFATENLGSNCTTYSDGTDTFLKGQCSENYIWYSGKLWRVVLKNNETGTVKMITDNAITTIPYNENENVSFENSYADQWLNQEFLPTLHDYENYLVENSDWYAIENSSTTPARPTGTPVQRTVGLLTSYEYYIASDKALSVVKTNYLVNGSTFWTLTSDPAIRVRCIGSGGGSTIVNSNQGYGIRPVVNLQSGIQIVDGTGTQSDPYILKNDIQKPENGTTLLNTKYSGEYVIFNDSLYRIVGSDTVGGEQLTKITAVDNPTSLASNVFHTSTGIGTTTFASAQLKTVLNNYYQSLSTSNKSAYDMIKPTTTWYLGRVGDGKNYKASICATVDVNVSASSCKKITDTTYLTTASVGLPRVGEMFTSQITRGTKANFWTLTAYSSVLVRYVDTIDYLNGDTPAYTADARPSMYLKSNVVIASDNTGNGTYEKPYSIELGA